MVASMSDKPIVAALVALAEKVEAGDRVKLNRTMAEIGHPSDAWPCDWMSRVDAAFVGSLDAAKVLHVALLGDGAISTPGYYACVWMRGKASVWNVISNASHSAEILGRQDHEASPARAWLLAILRALIAQEDNKS